MAKYRVDGQRVRQLREKMALAQDEFAHKAGLSRRTIQKAEKGEFVGNRTLNKLRTAFKTDDNSLLITEDAENIPCADVGLERSGRLIDNSDFASKPMASEDCFAMKRKNTTPEIPRDSQPTPSQEVVEFDDLERTRCTISSIARSYLHGLHGRGSLPVELSLEDLERAANGITPRYWGIVVSEELGEDHTGLVANEPIRPAEDDGSSWYAASVLTKDGIRVRDELSSLIEYVKQLRASRVFLY